MDGRRFDDLTRLFGHGTTRRRVVAAALGLAAIAVDGGVASARRATCRQFGAACTRGAQCCSGRCDTRRQAPRNLRNRCACAVGEARCNGACIDTTSNVDNCGGCGEVCDSLEICVSGACVCDSGLTACDGVCVDLETDADRCGDCGAACDTVDGEVCCDGSCVDLMTDPDHCGACDAIPCATLSGEICEAGVCLVPLCPTQDGKGVAATDC
jgi:hypothetical protein